MKREIESFLIDDVPPVRHCREMAYIARPGRAARPAFVGDTCVGMTLLTKREESRHNVEELLKEESPMDAIDQFLTTKKIKTIIRSPVVRSAAPDPAVRMEAQEIELLASGKKINAIKLYRERTGAGLHQSVTVANWTVESLNGFFATNPRKNMPRSLWIERLQQVIRNVSVPYDPRPAALPDREGGDDDILNWAADRHNETREKAGRDNRPVMFPGRFSG